MHSLRTSYWQFVIFSTVQTRGQGGDGLLGLKILSTPLYQQKARKTKSKKKVRENSKLSENTKCVPMQTDVWKISVLLAHPLKKKKK